MCKLLTNCIIIIIIVIIIITTITHYQNDQFTKVKKLILANANNKTTSRELFLAGD